MIPVRENSEVVIIYPDESIMNPQTDSNRASIVFKSETIFVKTMVALLFAVVHKLS
jgi:hypothetical protein